MNRVFLPFLAGLLVSSANAEPDPAAPAADKPVTRLFFIAGYIPGFPSQKREDRNEFGRPASDYVKSFLKGQGIEVGMARFFPAFNVLILTDTKDQLGMAEVGLRRLFAPDFQLPAIKAARECVRNDAAFDPKHSEGDPFGPGFVPDKLLPQNLILEDQTLRTFDNEVRKLSDAMEEAPEGSDERARIQKRLEIAKKCLDKARKLFLESLDQQEALIKEWQSENLKLGQDKPVELTTPAKPAEADQK